MSGSNDGTRWKGSEMELREPPSERERHIGCCLFVSRTGHSGFALGQTGNRSGWLYDFFVSPRETKELVPELLFLAVRQGANRLVAYDDPLLIRFFSQAGFFPVARTQLREIPRPPADWVPAALSESATSNGLPDIVFLKRRGPTSRDEANLADLSNRRYVPCVHCEENSAKGPWRGVLEAFQCPSCDLVHVGGSLALGPWAGGADPAGWSGAPWPSEDSAPPPEVAPGKSKPNGQHKNYMSLVGELMSTLAMPSMMNTHCATVRPDLAGTNTAAVGALWDRNASLFQRAQAEIRRAELYLALPSTHKDVGLETTDKILAVLQAHVAANLARNGPAFESHFCQTLPAYLLEIEHRTVELIAGLLAQVGVANDVTRGG